MRFMFDTDEAFSFETLRAVGYTVYGGADIGEVIMTAERITPGDGESWYREWRALADRTASIADGCAAGGHMTSASGAYLKASNYYRTSEFFLRDDPEHDPRVAETSALAVQTFRSAHEVQARWRPVRIPYEGIELDGYYLNVSGDVRGPTLVAHGGFDSTVEEMYFAVGEAARRYGWNCLIFEGPGQGAVLRTHGLPFRHDWEAVITPVVDFAIDLPGVDGDRIALLGMSLGGYLAPRAAAFESRIAACVAYDGVFRIAGAFLKTPEAQVLDPTDRLALLDNLIARRSEASSSQRWLLSNSLWTFGVSSAKDLYAEIVKYDLTGVADRITCPTLVCDAENDQFAAGQPAMLYEALDCPKTFLPFTSAEGAGEHCHEGALTLFHQRLFDWLDETIA
ncbi:alpha/beta hydrolase family protein [Tamaricihabitans halophyticus]|uniref:Alpha/beta hydrolase family protein n=1 Tax=Tamaricihabitans halophyticus TaxID=1262583 RepID=A0A4R2PV44_9PSEU|nr:alpha/beta fold hydrolase [Tamaricihabitans halophyticus]TCP38958.1 alpha/beta hydrolase family protein [Tamaricihabitans halophyticus]